MPILVLFNAHLLLAGLKQDAVIGPYLLLTDGLFCIVSIKMCCVKIKTSVNGRRTQVTEMCNNGKELNLFVLFHL